MKPNAVNLRHELKKIAGMQALSLARYYLLFVTAINMLYSFFQRGHVYSMYIFFFTLLAPFFMEQIPKNHTNSSKSQLLPVLKEEYQYDKLRYHCLLWTFWLDNLLLVVWVIKSTLLLSDIPFHHVPFFLLGSHIFIYLLFFYYYQFKFHYQLINNHW